MAAVAGIAESPPGFIEEIKFDELAFKESIGKGAFGVVYEAIYRQNPVAVKMIESESERRAFITELRQLSRVSHPNIIRLYGACSNPVSLVMELAECGSLYNLLHGAGPLPHYTGSHGISWCLQCARGVAYLHSMKPKALIHRDLKPPNLLLTNQGLTLKICDFGTACDIHTQMTNNKGSAAWMAPEVFEGCQYSERCDVFSWGIILWEVVTRRKPFDELGGPAFRIMWAVHTGTRPPLIQGCPKPVEDLMTRCWSKVPSNRPSMDEVVQAVQELMPFFPNPLTPLVFPPTSEMDYLPDEYETDGGYATSYTSTISETMRKTQISGPSMDRGMHGSISAPNVQKIQDMEIRSRSNSSSPAPEATPLGLAGKFGSKRRSSSDLIAEIEKSPIERKSPVHSRSGSPARIRSSSNTSSPLVTPVNQAPELKISVVSPPPRGPIVAPHVARDSPLMIYEEPGCYDDYAYANDCTSPKESKSNSLPMSYLALELHLQPLPPTTSSKESMQIYEQHCRLAEEYLRVQTEITLLKQRKETLTEELQREEKDKMEGSKLVMEYQQLHQQNQYLTQVSTKMKREVERARMTQQRKMS